MENFGVAFGDDYKKRALPRKAIRNSSFLTPHFSLGSHSPECDPEPQRRHSQQDIDRQQQIGDIGHQGFGGG